MDIEKGFANPDLEREGVWLDYREDTKLKVARAGNAKFQSVYEAKSKPHLRKRRAGTLDAATERRILAEAVAEGILLDWSGFERDGKPLKCSVKEATKYLISSVDFLNEVVEMAAVEENFHADTTEESVKNS